MSLHMDLIWTGQSPMRIQNWGVLLLTSPWGLLQQPSQVPHPLVNSKIHRWKVKEKEQDKSLMLRAGSRWWGPSCQISSSNLPPELQAPSWCVCSSPETGGVLDHAQPSKRPAGCCLLAASLGSQRHAWPGYDSWQQLLPRNKGRALGAVSMPKIWGTGA